MCSDFALCKFQPTVIDCFMTSMLIDWPPILMLLDSQILYLLPLSKRKFNVLQVDFHAVLILTGL